MKVLLSGLLPSDLELKHKNKLFRKSLQNQDENLPLYNFELKHKKFSKPG